MTVPTRQPTIRRIQPLGWATLLGLASAWILAGLVRLRSAAAIGLALATSHRCVKP